MENKYCKDCKERKNKFCVVKTQFVPRKGVCEEFKQKEKK